MKKTKKKKQHRHSRRMGPRENASANGGAPCGVKHANMCFSRRIATLLKTLLLCDTRATLIMHILNVLAQHSTQTTPVPDFRCSLCFKKYIYT